MNKQEQHIIIFIMIMLIAGLGVHIYRKYTPAAPHTAASLPVNTIISININTADINELQKISGIGPVIARRIIDYRNQHGMFTAIDRLLDVQGIGPKKLQKMRPHITLN